MAQISFTGNIAKPDLKFSKAGKAYFTFSVAENHRRKDQAGQWVESGTTWRRVTFFGNALFTPEALAEAAVQGTFVLVEGREETREYEKDGETRSSLEVTANNVGVMAKAPREQRGQYGGQASQEQTWGGASGGNDYQW